MATDDVLRLELDVDTETDERFAQVAMEWLDDGSRLLEPELRHDLEVNPSLIPDYDDPEQPWGPAGAAIGDLSVYRRGATRLNKTTRPPSVQGWQWLRRQLLKPPFAATVMLRRMGSDGLPEVFCDLQIQVHESAPDWMRLVKDLPAHLLTQAPIRSLATWSPPPTSLRSPTPPSAPTAQPSEIEMPARPTSSGRIGVGQDPDSGCHGHNAGWTSPRLVLLQA